MPRTPSDQPTDGELEILNVLWDRGPSELGAVHAALNERRKVALTTVATMLSVMLGKGLVSRKKSGRAFAWSPRMSRSKAARGLVGKVIDGVFDGSTERLVAHLLDDQKLTNAERDEILRLLQNAKSRLQQGRTKR
jgi:predicted transcriptional regulator